MPKSNQKEVQDFFLVHKGSLIKILIAVYPNENWKIWKFHQVPKGFWDNPQNQLDFFNWLSQDLKITKWEDWYTIKLSDIKDRGGTTLMASHFNDSIFKALKTIYPNEFNWEIWRFSKVPSGYWDNVENQRSCLLSIAQQLQIPKKHKSEGNKQANLEFDLDGWYKIKASDVEEKGGSGLLYHFQGSLFKALQSAFPEKEWHFHLFRQSRGD